MSILGTRVLRVEDPKFLTVGGTYTADLPLDGVAYVTYVRSPVAHARITTIDTSVAAQAPGVIGVFTGDDVELTPLVGVMGMAPPAMARPRACRSRARTVRANRTICTCRCSKLLRMKRAQATNGRNISGESTDILPGAIHQEISLW